MYSAEFQDSIRAVEAARAANIAYEPARMTAQEKEDLLAAYHPDYKKSEFSELKIGPNRGEKVPHELCEMLQAHSRIQAADVDLIEVRLSRGMGGKCFVLMTGEVADVRSAVSAACEIVEKDGMLAACTVIPSPHEDLKKYLF